MMPDFNQLKKISIFQGLSEQTLKEFFNYFNMKTMEIGTVIFKEKTMGDTLYIILEGEVIIEKKLDVEGREFKELAVLGGGDFFGEMAVLENQTRFAQARVSKKSNIYEIHRCDLMNFIKQSPEAGISFYNGIMRTLLKRLKYTSNELTMLFDLSRQLMVNHRSPADFLAVAIDEIRPYLDGDWNIDAFAYNVFNEEYDSVYRFTAYEQNEEERKLPSEISNGWLDERTYSMSINRENKRMACVIFRKNETVEDASKHSLTTIFNTISYIICSNMLDVEHQAELVLIAKLKQAKSI